MKLRSSEGKGAEYPYMTLWAGPSAAPFDTASLLAQQQRSGAAMAAAGHVFLQGMQQIATRSFLVQSALFRQGFVGALALLRVGSGPQADQAIRDLGAASEATAEAIRDIVEAACKCSFDTIAAFRRRIGDGSAGGAAGDLTSRHG